jgi:tetratricopeptide (TPR) repeat protein
MSRVLPRVLAAIVAVAFLAPAVHAQSPAEQLTNAKRLFDALNYEQAAGVLDQLVAGAPTPPIRDLELARVFAGAYELRARARFFLGDVEGARSDFRALVKIEPGHELPLGSAKVKAIFDEIVKAGVGRIVLNLSPPDAELQLDGVPFPAVAGSIPVSVGIHTIGARRSGCRPASQDVTVAADTTKEVVIALERISAALQVVTVPTGVDLVVDGTARGKTEAGPLSPPYAEFPAKLGLPADAFSKPFMLDGLPQGNHVIEFRRACYTPAERRVSIEQFADYRIEPVKLEKAVASVTVESSAAGASVLLDGEVRGPAPQSFDDVCEGSHIVEIRSPGGRHFERIEARAGARIVVRGVIRPAVALLGINGLPDGYRGPDQRLGIERALAGSRAVTFFAPPDDRLQQALRAESLSPGWLAFDKSRRPIGAGASAITDTARIEIAKRLGRALEVQGLAEATLVPGSERNLYLVTILSTESARPDVLELTLEDAPSINAAILRLDAMPAFYRPTVGVNVADVLDVSGAVVIGADGPAGPGRLAPGDLVLKADGQPVADAAGFLKALAAHKGGEKLAVDARERSGAAKHLELTVVMAPKLLAMSDESWLFNGLVLGLRAKLAAAQADDAVIRLNLAVALMRVGNWADALAELGRVQLPVGPGVSNGTVQYLLGLCHEALGQPAEAERAWRAASADADSLLTEDGPGVKELAERRLAVLLHR